MDELALKVRHLQNFLECTRMHCDKLENQITSGNTNAKMQSFIENKVQNLGRFKITKCAKKRNPSRNECRKK